MRHRRKVFSSVLSCAAFAISACAHDSTPSTFCPAGGGAGGVLYDDNLRKPQIFGGNAPDRFDVAASVWDNIVALRPEGLQYGEDSLCTGVHLTARLVLTAAHCLSGARTLVHNELAEKRAAHPSLDLGLFLLSAGSCQAQLREGLRLSRVQPSLGQDVLLAGFGLTEDGTLGTLLAVEQTVTFIDDTYIRVDGKGESGACSGDSGGPLLWGESEPRVIGILSTGEASCRGLDQYVLVDPSEEWIKTQAAKWEIDIEL